MAAVLVVLVFLNSFLTGILLVRDAQRRRTVEELTGVCQTIEHDYEVMAHELRGYTRGAGMVGGEDAR